MFIRNPVSYNNLMKDGIFVGQGRNTNTTFRGPETDGVTSQFTCNIIHSTRHRHTIVRNNTNELIDASMREINKVSTNKRLVE